MSSNEVKELLEKTLGKASNTIRDLEQIRNSTVIAFVDHQGIMQPTVYNLHKLLRRIGSVDALDLVIESVGGDLDATLKMVKLLKSYSKCLRTIVPYYAKKRCNTACVKWR